MDDFNEQEHPTPTCPVCESNKTRPLDMDVAFCFGCENTWHHENDYSDHFEFHG